MYQWRVVYTYHMEPYIYIGIMENNSIYICKRHIYEESYICLFVLQKTIVYICERYIFVKCEFVLEKKGDKGFLGGNKKNILSNYKIHKLLFQSL